VGLPWRPHGDLLFSPPPPEDRIKKSMLRTDFTYFFLISMKRPLPFFRHFHFRCFCSNLSKFFPFSHEVSAGRTLYPPSLTDFSLSAQPRFPPLSLFQLQRTQTHGSESWSLLYFVCFSSPCVIFPPFSRLVVETFAQFYGRTR